MAQKKEVRKKFTPIQRLQNGGHERQEGFSEEDGEDENEEGEGEQESSLENEFD